ncbi:O-antigen ligase family protein [Sphingomonas sp. H39-1-10]|uniref:O-antigen ligase family protein n=1 Tax=Sphingomonas pollutisoli TaxID=3030829 RepID=UPI0023B9A192|nr:O-antigen ligase family protein [Sphingomonas pollutisoli]MDF0490947.1 O-antigen ligase family protein [Sphingomonas pollutisoli]
MPNRIRRISDMSQPVHLRLAMAAMVGLLILTLFGPAMTTLGETESGAGNVLRQAGYAWVFAFAVIAMRPLKHPERLAVVPWPFWLALAWCWLSLAWALDPGVAVRRLVLTTIIIWSAFAIVRQLGIERTLLFVRLALVAMLIINFVTVIVFPSIGLHDTTSDDPLLVGKWRGLMGHKNQAGLLCALTILFFVYDRRKLPYALMAAVVISSTVFLWFSASKTSLGLVFVAAAAGIGIAHAKKRYGNRHSMSAIGRSVLMLAIALILVPIIHFSVQSDWFLNYLADPSGLTGRTQIWAAMMRYYLNNPVFSAGYGSFWNIGNASPMLTFGKGWVLSVSEGHNGYLDLLVTIGLPGLVLVLMATFVFPARRLFVTTRLSHATVALVAAVLLFCFMHNFTESSLFDRDTLGQVFLLIVLGMLWTGENLEGRSDLPGRAKKTEDPAYTLNRSARVRAGINSSHNPGRSRRR